MTGAGCNAFLPVDVGTDFLVCPHVLLEGRTQQTDPAVLSAFDPAA
jgi:hypothetical protein